MEEPAAATDAERFSDLVTQKLLKLPKDPHYIELKRCLRYAMKADKIEDSEAAAQQYLNAEKQVQLLLNAQQDQAAGLKGIMGLIKKRLRYHQEKVQAAGGPKQVTNTEKKAPLTSVPPPKTKKPRVDKTQGSAPIGRRKAPSNNRIGSLKRDNSRQPKGPRLKMSIINELYRTTIPCIFIPTNDGTGYNPQELLQLLQSALCLPNNLHHEILASLTDCSFENLLARFQYQLDHIDQHPYYEEESFPCHDDYQNWKTSEKKRISAVKAMVAQENPRIKPANKFEPFENELPFHELYFILASQISSFENQDLSTELNSSSVWILREFGVHYQVRELYREIINIEASNSPFSKKLNRICRLRYSLNTSIKLLRAGEPITITEKKRMVKGFQQSFHSIKNELGKMFSDYCMPTDMNSLRTMIQILVLLNEGFSYFQEETFDEDQVVTLCIKNAIENRYKTLLGMEGNGGDVAVSPKQLGLLVEILEVELANSYLFQATFKDYGDIVAQCCSTFSTRLLSDIRLVLDSFGEGVPIQDVLDIAGKLDAANTKLTKKFPDFTPIPVHELFPTFIYDRITAVSKEVEVWIKDICADEEWIAIDSRQFFSKSSKDIFRTVMNPINLFRSQSFLDPALYEPPQADKSFLVLYGEKVVAKGILCYANQIHKRFFSEAIPDKEIADRLRKVFPRKAPLPTLYSLINFGEKKRKDEPVDGEVKKVATNNPLTDKQFTELHENLNIPSEICVMISNLAQCQDMTKRLAEQYEREFKNSYGGVIDYLNNLASVLVMFLIYWVDSRVYIEIKDFLKKRVETPEEVFFVIDSQLLILAQNLDSLLFERQFLPGLWKAAIFNIKQIVTKSTKDGKKISKGTSERINELTSSMIEYFNQGGKGLHISILDRDCGKLNAELAELGKKKKVLTQKEIEKAKEKDKEIQADPKKAAKQAKTQESKEKKAAKKKPRKRIT